MLSGSMFFIYFYTASFLAVWAMAVLIILPVLTWALNFYTKKHISVFMRMPATSSKNKDAEIRVILSNDSVFPVFCSYVEVLIKNTLTDESEKVDLCLSAASKGSSEGSFTVNSDKCGYLRVSIGKILLADIFGFLPVKTLSDSEGKMTVMPDTFEMNISIAMNYVSSMDEEDYSPDKSGNDYSETFQIREYVPGDSLKSIHWKLSDKLDKTMVREASLPVMKNILVFWDKNVSDPSSEEMDAMAEVTTSLCRALCDEGLSYTIGFTDGEENVFEDISHTDELFRLAGQMLKSGYSGGISGAERYMRDNGPAQYSKVIYIASAVTDISAEFAGAGSTAVVCSENYPADMNVISFTSGDYPAKLEAVEL